MNGKLETRASKGLESEVRAFASAQTAPAWIGYAVPMVEGRHESCGHAVTQENGTRSGSQLRRVALEGDPTLLVFLRAADRQVTRVRSQALFWLAQKASAKAAGAIAGALRDDPDTEVKRRAVFALSRLPKDEGIPRLIEVARTNRNPEVRKQAFFWLGQSKDPRALGFFQDVLAGR